MRRSSLVIPFLPAMLSPLSMLPRLLLVLLFVVSSAFATDAADPGRPLRGVVTRVLAEKKLVMVQHEEIPGFMRAMTMAFSVDDAVFPQLTPGTHLTATLHGSRGNWRLAGVQLTDEKYQPLPPPPPAAPVYPVALSFLTSPAPAGAIGATLTRGPDGTIYLSWLESTDAGLTRLRFARYDATNARWLEPRLIAEGRDWVASDLNHPQLAVQGNGRFTAVWFVTNPTADPVAPAGGHHAHSSNFKAWFSQSTDYGQTWSAPAPLSPESDFTEFVALQALADPSGVLAVWLDGRAKRTGGDTQQLRGRILGANGPDQLLDDSVCDCCPTALTAFPDGSALIAYRARRAGEVRDIHTVRYRAGRWSAPRVLSADDWRIHGCPVNGPQLDSIGGLAAAAWFTAADNDPRVLASASPDAGARFVMPQRLDLGHAIGRVDTVILQDGSRLVTWLEGGDAATAGLYLRRIAANDELSPAIRLAPAPIGGAPRIALVKDYDRTPAQLLVTYTRDTEPSAIATLLVTLPDLSTLAGRKPCLPCDEQDAGATRGHAAKGIISLVDADSGTVTVKNEPIPGVMRAATLVCFVDPAVLPQLTPDSGYLGRIEKRSGDWWLFNVKLLGTAPR